MRLSLAGALLLVLMAPQASALVPAAVAAAAHAAAAAAASLHAGYVGAAAAVGAAGVHAGLGAGLTAAAQAGGAGVTAASASSGAAAVTHATAINAAAAAAGAAATSSAAAVVVVPEAMRDSGRPQLRAIGRILQIEAQRLKAAALSRGKPTEVVRRVHETAVTRAPIIGWALDLWFRSSLEPEQREAQGKQQLEPWQRAVVDGYSSATRNKVPDLLYSLKVLQRELASQVRFGLRTSPLRVVKLLYSSLLVTLFVLVARCPGLSVVRAGVARRWPKLVDHLAATLERNLAVTESVVTSRDGTLMLREPGAVEDDLSEDLKNLVEDMTGLDIDGDGFVGKPPAPPRPSWLDEARMAVARIGDLSRRPRSAIRMKNVPPARVSPE